jgi:hypothetical protein
MDIKNLKSETVVMYFNNIVVYVVNVWNQEQQKNIDHHHLVFVCHKKCGHIWEGHNTREVCGQPNNKLP